MKNIKIIISLLITILMVSCGGKKEDNQNHSGHNHGPSADHNHGKAHEDVVFFSQQQFDAFSIKIDTISKRNISSYVEANGRLEVPPQNEASVTTILGANVVSIKVIEGDKVFKGQILAMISHPDFIKLQTDYVKAWNQLQFLEKDYQRQKKLYNQKVGSGKEFQKITADYLSTKGMVNGYEAQLKIIGLDVEQIKKSEIFELIPLRSPISGYVQLVQVKTGQYVLPEKELFQIVNIHHIHADLMVYEKDVYKVKEGQKVKFSVESESEHELEAVIYSVGRAFEEEPKAIHLHAEIENKEGVLLPGMYVQGRILIDDQSVLAVHEEAVVREGEKYFVFTAEKITNNGGQVFWKFTPLEIRIGNKDGEWVEVKLLNPLEPGTQIAMNNAYYLISELKKEEAEHSH